MSTALPVVGPAVQWANGFAAPPRIPLAGDVDGDGFCDLIAVYAPGDSIIDVCPNVHGTKAGVPFQALTGWGKDCQAAVTGQFDDHKGTDVAGLFGGTDLRVAGSFSNGHFVDEGVVVSLPIKLDKPCLAQVFGGFVLAFSTSTGKGFLVNPKSRDIESVTLPQNVVWIGQSRRHTYGQDSFGNIFEFNNDRWSIKRQVSKEPSASRPCCLDDGLVFGAEVMSHEEISPLSQSGLPDCPIVRVSGDFDADGDQDVFEYRYGTEPHSTYEVLLRIQSQPGESDSDHDGLTNETETGLGTDPLNPDTDGDGLWDGWETGTFRNLDFKALNCDPRHTDVICLVSRFENVNEGAFKSEMERVRKFYSELPTPNVDGKTGFNFHAVMLDPIKGADMNNPWWTNRDKYRPWAWKGLVHWMQVTPGGGGQADQLGDGGSVAENALWAVFIHEFGHQMGMDHEGFWPNGLCPIYTSLMNYAYSYGLEDDYNKIHYSDGRLKNYVLRETDLDETIPLPYEQVKFLEKGPYRFRLKSNGATTLIDWNWNGVFGEKHVRADINYSYSTNAGRRDDVGKTRTAPWLVVTRNKAYVLFGANDAPADPTKDPTLGADNPGDLILRKLIEPFQWEAPIVISKGDLIGDPVALDQNGNLTVIYQSSKGVVERTVTTPGTLAKITDPKVVESHSKLVPTVGRFGSIDFLFLWNPDTQVVQVKTRRQGQPWVGTRELDVTSSNPVGLCQDTLNGDAIVAVGQNQDGNKTNRWQVRRYHVVNDQLVFKSLDWVEGEKGNARGTGRLTVLFDASKNAGKNGRIYLYGKGLTNKDVPWSCTYVAHQVVDKSVNSGWMVKRYYDEWTQSRSAPAAAWFGKDVIWSYRWVDGGQGPTDNNLHVGYKGLGIQDEPMGDHDDLTFFRTWGIRNAILYLSPEP